MSEIQHKIENINDIFIDFCVFVNQSYKFKKEYPEAKISSMLWTDDGVHEITGVSLNGDMVNFRKTK